MMKKLDKLDKALWNRVKDNQGLSIRAVIRPFLLQRSESVLRDRVRSLELLKLIRTTKTKKEVLCFTQNKIVNSPMLSASSSSTEDPQPQENLHETKYCQKI